MGENDSREYSEGNVNITYIEYGKSEKQEMVWD